MPEPHDSDELYDENVLDLEDYDDDDYPDYDDDDGLDDFYDYDDSMDGDHDSAMRDAGWGTDEDYGYYGE